MGSMKNTFFAPDTTIKIWSYEKVKLEEVAERNNMYVQELIELLVNEHLDDVIAEYHLR